MRALRQLEQLLRDVPGDLMIAAHEVEQPDAEQHRVDVLCPAGGRGELTRPGIDRGRLRRGVTLGGHDRGAESAVESARSQNITVNGRRSASVATGSTAGEASSSAGAARSVRPARAAGSASPYADCAASAGRGARSAIASPLPAHARNSPCWSTASPLTSVSSNLSASSWRSSRSNSSWSRR